MYRDEKLIRMCKRSLAGHKECVFAMENMGGGVESVCLLSLRKNWVGSSYPPEVQIISASSQELP